MFKVNNKDTRRTPLTFLTTLIHTRTLAAREKLEQFILSNGL